MKYLKDFNENKSQIYFFDQDESSHWYMLPIELKEKWVEMTTNDIGDDYDKQEEFQDLFNEYMLGGGINNISFENPNKL